MISGCCMSLHVFVLVEAGTRLYGLYACVLLFGERFLKSKVMSLLFVADSCASSKISSEEGP